MPIIKVDLEMNRVKADDKTVTSVSTAPGEDQAEPISHPPQVRFKGPP